MRVSAIQLVPAMMITTLAVLGGKIAWMAIRRKKVGRASMASVGRLMATSNGPPE